jgi:hypothetical protein
VSLPFHVWVRETADGRARWVLRDARTRLREAQWSGPAADRSPAGRGGSS